jgi:hypothetical protein
MASATVAGCLGDELVAVVDRGAAVARPQPQRPIERRRAGQVTSTPSPSSPAMAPQA